jgi:hypothetical protein
MTLARADIITRVLSSLGPVGPRAGNLDDEIADVLMDLSERGDFIEMSDTAAATAGQAYIDIAAKKVKWLKSAAVAGGNHLTLGSMDEYQRTVENNASPARGLPTKYFIFKDRLYLYDLIPSENYTVNLDYYKLHADSADSPEVDERYRRAIVEGVLSYLFAGKLSALGGAADQYLIHNNRYQAFLNQRQRNAPQEAILIQYKDV